MRCYSAAAAALSWRSMQPAEARFSQQCSPTLSHAKFMTAAKHKRRVGSSSVSRSRYRFSNPKVLYPKTSFGGVTGSRSEGSGREEEKCSCLAWVYFHPLLQSFFFITVRRGSRLPSSTGLSLVSLRTPEKALIFYLLWVQVEAVPDF